LRQFLQLHRHHLQRVVQFLQDFLEGDLREVYFQLRQYYMIHYHLHLILQRLIRIIKTKHSILMGRMIMWI
jgi:hypothetical protein